MCHKFILGWILIYRNCLFLSFLIRNVILNCCCSLLTFAGSLFSRSFVVLKIKIVEEDWKVLVVGVEEGLVKCLLLEIVEALEVQQFIISFQRVVSV